MPHYLEQLDPGRTLAWNLAHRLLRRGAVLYQEAELLLREELREPRRYFSILRAISDGCTRVGEITARVSRSSPWRGPGGAGRRGQVDARLVAAAEHEGVRLISAAQLYA